MTIIIYIVCSDVGFLCKEIRQILENAVYQGCNITENAVDI
jgi:hypothetical protein